MQKMIVICISLLFIGLILFILEVSFFFSGQQAGYIYRSTLRTPKELVLYDNYIMDESGIMKFNQETREEVRAFIKQDEPLDRNAFMNRKLDVVVKFLKLSYSKNALDKAKEGDFCSRSLRMRLKSLIGENALHEDMIYCGLQSSPLLDKLDSLPFKDHKTDLDSAYIRYRTDPINSDGFRGIEFKNYQTTRKKILFIGDSFTFGFSAGSLANSFPDLLGMQDYVSYNTGMPATGPIQYAQVAEKYVPLLQPDVVCVNFFMGNDIITQKEDVVPHQFRSYPTNVGYIRANQNGQYFPDFQDAFDFNKSITYIPYTDSNRFNALCSKFIITTKFWTMLCKNNLLGQRNKKAFDDLTNNYIEAMKFEQVVSEFYLSKIKDICVANDAIFLLTLIPDKYDLEYNLIKDIPGLFGDLNYYMPDGFDESDFFGITGHYSRTGHQKHADFIKQQMEQLMSQDTTSTP